MYREDLFVQELIFEQFNNVPPETPPSQPVSDPGGAITGLTSNTLVVGGKVGTLQNVELPQPLGTTSDPTFDDVTCDNLVCNVLNTADDATSRSNLGLGGLSTQSPGAAVPNLSQTISSPPTQAEVQNIQTKLNDLLTSLRNAGIIAT
jgi:hypothetical protein